MNNQNGKFFNILNNQVMPVAVKIGGQRHLIAVRDGIATTIPFVITGSIFLIFQSLPIPGYDEFVANIFGSDWSNKLSYAINGTFSLIALISVFSIAYNLAETYKLNSQTSGIISLSSFLVLLPLTPDQGFPLDQLGSKGLFVGIIVSLLSTEIFNFMIEKGIYMKLPDTIPPKVTQSFVALFPTMAIVIFFVSLRWLIEAVGMSSIFNIITIAIGVPLKAVGGGYWGGLIAIIAIHLFWSVGVHGANVVGSILFPIWLAQTDENRVAFQAGKELPNIITSSFFDGMLWLGGSGVLLSLAILITFFSRSTQFKELGKVGFIPTIFTINEPFIFGIPVVLNPTILIPYFLTPIVNYNIIYWTMYFGICPKPSGVIVPWTTPPLINGFLSTNGSLMAVLIQVICLLVGIGIYYPFFKTMDNTYYNEEHRVANMVE